MKDQGRTAAIAAMVTACPTGVYARNAAVPQHAWDTPLLILLLEPGKRRQVVVAC